LDQVNLLDLLHHSSLVILSDLLRQVIQVIQQASLMLQPISRLLAGFDQPSNSNQAARLRNAEDLLACWIVLPESSRHCLQKDSRGCCYRSVCRPYWR